MNLAQIVTAIGQRTGQIGPRDVTACRNFVGIRYNQLWQAFLWKDSLVEYVVTIDPSADYVPTSPYLPTKGHLILPSIIGNVIAVRSNQDKMNVERPMMYFRVGQDQFTKHGQPCEFYLLSSCVWEFDVVEDLFLGLSNNADAGQSAIADLLNADGVSVDRVREVLQVLGLNIGSSDRIDALIKPVTNGTVSLSVGGVTQSLIPDGAQFTDPGPALAWYQYNVIGWTPGAGYRLTFGANETFVSIAGTVTANPGAGQSVNIVAPNAGEEFYLASATQDLPVTATLTTNVNSTNILTLQATDTAAPKRQRVRFVRIPDNALTIRVLGKRVTPQLSDDHDEPGVRGMDAILYAMATYDMAHRDEFSKVGAAEAEILLAESVGPEFLTSRGTPGGFLKKLIEEETDQAAHNSRIMPEHGFGGHELDGDCRATKSNPYGF